MTIDKIKKNCIFPNFVSHKLGCGDSYSRGCYSIGREIIEKCIKKIKSIVEKCSNLEGFIVINSILGGTGAGLSISILNRLKVNFPKKFVIQSSIVGSPDLCNGPMEIYNIAGHLYNAIQYTCLLYTSPSPRDGLLSRMPSSA